MQGDIAPRDRIHKSDGRQSLTNGRRFVILSAKRKLRWFLDSQKQTSLDGSIRTNTFQY
jgi:hypothetical protein